MLWGLKWYSANRLDGVTEYLIYHVTGVPAVFKTRREAREFATDTFGYIRTRTDLRREPHGWRMPRPVKVQVCEVK